MSYPTRSLPLPHDLTSAVLAAQALSSEHELDEMLETIVRTLLEHAGAYRGWIYLREDGQWVAAGEGAILESEVRVSLPAQTGAALPPAVTRKLLEQFKPVLVTDPEDSPTVLPAASIRGIEGNPILFLPMVYQHELVAVLRLELMPGSFALERLEMLDLLATQAAISLSNLRMLDELKAAEETARANELKFRHLFQNIPMGIFEIDISEVTPVIRAANRRAESLYGWTEEEFLQMDPMDLFLTGAGWEFGRLVGAVSKGETTTLETIALRRDGTGFPARLIATPEHGPHAKHLVLSVEDITAIKQRRSEAEAVDEERRRMAQEIHDGVAQDLAALRLKISVWHEWIDNCPAMMHAELDQLQQILDESMEEIRRSIYALRPVALDEVGFFPAIQSYLMDVRSQYPLYIDMDIAGPEEHLPQTLELPLFRVLQEAIHNIIKHAGASLVRISLDLSEMNKVSLTVQDNGRGFDVDERESALRAGHLGLKQMGERVEKAKGSLMIFSQPGQGTEIKVYIPAESEFKR